MACYHPLIAYARRDEFGKREIVFASDHKKDCYVDPRSGKFYYEKLELPCGQCIGCRLEYSRQWSIRCLLELKMHDPSECWFLTLTYSPDKISHLERFYSFPSEETGELLEGFRYSLCKRDLQLFMKRLRITALRDFGAENIRFYACGEYGEKGARPHFHVIIYGLPLHDLVKVSSNYRGDVLFSSDWLSEVWGYGFVGIGEVNFDTCAYVARYMMKKHKGRDSVYYDNFNISPEFSTMSRRPGIARDYYDEHSGEIYSSDNLVICGSDGKPMRVKPPSYYDRLFDIDNPEEMAEIKANRMSHAKLQSDSVMERTSVDRPTYLKVCESNKLLSIGNLKRTLD